MSPKSPQIKVPHDKSGSLTDKAYRELEERIVTLRLRPGEVLSETALSEQLKIGRTPIREALQRLAREGLVVILPRKGILVSEINPGKQLLVLEVRRELDSLMARAGSVRATEEERQAFLEIAAGMDQAALDNDEVEFLRFDNAYNELVATAAHNEYAIRAIGLMNSLSRRFWYVHYKETADLPHCARLHAAVARCIAEGDTEGAAEASDRLIDYVETFTRSTVNTVLVR
ncbi:MAG: GntR family transcriptional regulator [Rhodospirillaceae bacterium]|nr:GntR family transcriptional regulator [Rhodospirillaceae bacterium]MBL6931731.1 GntR family transcriptional regulator [Rhodospirillales bacterium]